MAAATPACGKKGPPLAPLHLVPEPPASLKARVIGNTVFLATVVPAKNTSGRDPVAIDRLEVYAVTAAQGATAPPNRALLNEPHAIGRLEIKPPPDPDAPVDDTAEKDMRPAPGAKVNFVEQIGPAQLRPDVMPQPATPPKPKARGTAATMPAPPPDTLSVATRFYIARGLTKSGRPGSPSSRVAVPLVPPPPPPGPLQATFTEQAVSLTWAPPADAIQRISLMVKPGVPVGAGATVDPAVGLPDAVAPTWVPATPVYEVPPLSYNVYAAPGAVAPAAAAPAAAGPAAAAPNLSAEPKPLNDQPLADVTFEHPGAQPGKEQCFMVRSVQVEGDVSVESDADAPACVTPKDIFPPAAPKALAAVAGAGGINLIWDANTDPDLAGYLVLRGDAPGDTLQPLMAQPIHETRYVDTTARPGTLYVYVVVAVDTAGNRSANSNRVVETAR